MNLFLALMSEGQRYWEIGYVLCRCYTGENTGPHSGFFPPFQHRISLINHSVYSFVVELETQICKQMEKKTQQQKEKGKDEGIWGEKESFNRKLNRLELE